MIAVRRGLGWCVALLACLVLCSVFVASSASGAIYWGSSKNGIGAANLDGSNPIWDYFYWPYPDESDGPPCGVAVNSTHLYWAGYGGIGRRALEGDVYLATIVPGLRQTCGLALDGSHLYWGSFGAGTLGRANLDGSQATPAFVAGLDKPCGVAVGAGHLFWVERGGIGRANLDGSSPERSFVPLSPFHDDCGIAIAGRYLYWGEGTTVRRLDLESEGAPVTLVSGAGGVEILALDDNHVYWVNRSDDNVTRIGRANLDGSGVNPAWIVTPEIGSGGLAVDGRPSPPPLTLPSRPVLFARNAEYNLRSGAARIGTYVPGQGDLRVTSRGLNWEVFRSAVPQPAWAGAYLWQVRFRAGKGKVGKRIRKQLRRRGWAVVKLRLEYTQARVYPVTASRRFVLRRYPGAGAGWVKHPKPPRP